MSVILHTSTTTPTTTQPADTASANIPSITPALDAINLSNQPIPDGDLSLRVRTPTSEMTSADVSTLSYFGENEGDEIYEGDEGDEGDIDIENEDISLLFLKYTQLDLENPESLDQLAEESPRARKKQCLPVVSSKTEMGTGSVSH